jgi:hypothetical protein
MIIVPVVSVSYTISLVFKHVFCKPLKTFFSCATDKSTQSNIMVITEHILATRKVLTLPTATESLDSAAIVLIAAARGQMLPTAIVCRFAAAASVRKVAESTHQAAVSNTVLDLHNRYLRLLRSVYVHRLASSSPTSAARLRRSSG